MNINNSFLLAYLNQLCNFFAFLIKTFVTRPNFRWTETWCSASKGLIHKRHRISCRRVTI